MIAIGMRDSARNGIPLVQLQEALDTVRGLNRRKEEVLGFLYAGERWTVVPYSDECVALNKLANPKYTYHPITEYQLLKAIALTKQGKKVRKFTSTGLVAV